MHWSLHVQICFAWLFFSEHALLGLVLSVHLLLCIALCPWHTHINRLRVFDRAGNAIPRRSPQPPPPTFRPLPPIRLVTSTVEISEVDDLAAPTPGELLKAANFKLTAMLGRFKTFCIDAILRHSHLSILPFVNRKLCIWPMFGRRTCSRHGACIVLRHCALMSSCSSLKHESPRIQYQTPCYPHSISKSIVVHYRFVRPCFHSLANCMWMRD